MSLKQKLLSERRETDRKIKEEIESQIKLVKESYEKRFVKVMTTIKESSAAATARTHHLQATQISEKGRWDLEYQIFAMPHRTFSSQARKITQGAASK